MSRELPTIEELRNILSYLPNNDRETWFSTFCIVGREYNCDEAAFKAVQDWAASYPDRKPEDASKERYEFMSSSRRMGPGIGSLIVKAKANGYQVPKKLRSFEAEVLAPTAARLASNTNIMLRELSPTEVSKSTPEAEIYRDVQSLGAQVLKYWLLEAPQSEANARLVFMAENAKRFRFLVPNQRVVAGALYDYCASHQDSPFVYVDFLNWCEIVGLDTITNAKLAPIVGANTIHNRETAAAAMDELCDLSWMLYVCQQASQLSSMLNDRNLAAFRQARTDAIRATEPPSSLESMPLDKAPRIVRNTVADMIDPTAKLKLFIPTGYPALDKFIIGFRRGEVTIGAAHSGIGKTWLAVDVVRHLIEEQHGRVVFFSTEMSAEAIYLRLFATVNNSQIDPASLAQKNTTGALNQMHQNFSQFAKAHSGVAGAPDDRFGINELTIYGARSGGLTLSGIKEALAIESQAAPVDLVVVDYLQNVVNDILPRNASRYDRVLDVMNTLDHLSAEYNCATLAMAQLNNPNRKQTADPKPNLYDIAECTYVVQPAAAVFMLYRDGKQSEENAASDGGWSSKAKALAEVPLKLMVTKSRYGSLTSNPLRTKRSDGSRFDFFE